MQQNKNTPSIRFAGFTDAWEQRKIGDICSISTGKSNTQDSVDDGKYPFFVRSPIIERSNRYLFEEEAVLTVGDGVGTGKVFHYVNGKYDLHQRVYRMFDFSGNVLAKYFYYFFSTHFYDRVMSMTAKTSVDSVRYEMIADMDILYPSSEEQEAIATFFDGLNDLITLHQRKYDHLVNIKKSMLEKMFPKNGETVPEVRFAGFTDAWEQREFGETFTFLQNNTLSRADLADSGEGARNIHYGDILVKFGECINMAQESLPIITNDSVINKYRSSFLRNGDIVLADTAEDETVGKCAEIIEEKGETIISGLHTIPCRPTCDFARGFLGYYMNSSSFHDQLIPLMQGIKVTSISKSALQTTMVQYPQEKEDQAQIGRMFQNLDELITLHQRKLERLQNIKKACLEKMFV